MQCTVYRSTRKSGAYLFVEEKDDFERVPDTLLKLLGRLEYSMDLELMPGRAMAQAEATEVIRLLREEGYYLQLPPADWIDS